MIISPLKYDRDIVSIQETDPDRIQHELTFMLNTTYCHLKSKQFPVLSYLTKLDPEFEKHLHQAKIVKLVETEHRSPNTEITLDLGDKNILRGQFTVRYDRDDLENYFNITKIINENKTDSNLTIDYKKWLELQDNNVEFLNYIHRILAFKLGNTFGKNGILIRDDGSKETYEGHHGLAMILPSKAAIEEGWKHMENIVNIDKGTMTYQELTITLSIVAKNHLAIRDGSGHIHLRLRRPLQGYTEMVGGQA